MKHHTLKDGEPFPTDGKSATNLPRVHEIAVRELLRRGEELLERPVLDPGKVAVWAYNCLNFFDTAFTADNAYSAHFQEFLKRSDRETVEGGVEDLERALDELTHGHGASAGTQEGSDDQSIIRTADPNSPPERKPAAKKEFDWGEFRRFPPRLRCYFVDVDVFYRRDPPRSRRTFRRCTNRILGELEECAREYLRLFESTHFSDSDLGRTWPRWRELVRPDAYPHEIVALDLLRHCERVRKRLLFMEETCAWDWPLKQLEDFAEILEGELKGLTAAISACEAEWLNLQAQTRFRIQKGQRASAQAKREASPPAEVWARYKELRKKFAPRLSRQQIQAKVGADFKISERTVRRRLQEYKESL